MENPQLKPWKILKSRYPLKDRWLTVRADTCKTAEGFRVHPYYILEYADWVDVVCFTSQKKILLTKQYRHGRQEINWEIPCGAIDPADPSPLHAARRELLEETGFSSEHFELISTYSANTATHANIIYCFAAFDINKVAQPLRHPTEIIQTHLVSLPYLFKLINGHKISQAAHLAGILLTLRRKGWLK